jgi:tRNA-dihydrouridine synthase B
VKISNVSLKNRTVLAPLAGWTDAVFRRICIEHGAALVVTEMASADGLVRDGKKSLDIARFSETERPISIQLFGAEPEILGQAAYIISELKPDFIDINCGCPAKKVVRRGGGSALMRDLNSIEAIGRAVVQATTIPVTVKLRSGWNDFVVVEACQRLEAVGVQAVTIHPRTQKMGFTGHSDWSHIRAVKDAVKIPVIGNGDINSALDARRMLDETGCDMVMIGRGARGNPWIFSQIAAYLDDGRLIDPPDFTERIDMCLLHLQRQVEVDGSYAAITMRKQIAFYIKAMPGARELRQVLFQLDDPDEVRAEMLRFRGSLKFAGHAAVMDEDDIEAVDRLEQY